MEIPNFSHLREDLAKALTYQKTLWNDGLRNFSEKYDIPLNKIVQKIESIENPNFVLKVRRFIDDYTQNVIPRPVDVEYERDQIGSIPIEWIKEKNAPELPLILFFHGGGYLFGSLEASWQLPSQLSKKANVNILSVNYRHAPEHPYPAALDDAIAAYNYLLKEKSINPKKILVSGASAGGGLALALLLRLRDENIPLPAGAVLFSPWTDLKLKGNSQKTNRDKDPDITKTELQMCASLYSGSPKIRKNPYLSPVYGDFKGLPPLLVDAGEQEILLDDSSRLVEIANQAGIEIEFKEWKDMNHVFHRLFSNIPEPNQAFRRITEFIRRVIEN